MNMKTFQGKFLIKVIESFVTGLFITPIDIV